VSRVRPVGETSPIQVPGKVAAAGGSRSAFRAQLTDAHLQKVNDRLDEMLKHIDHQGAALGRTLNLIDLKKYRQAIQSFFKEALKMGTQVRTELEWDSRSWEHRTLVTIDKVNRELDELAALVHAQEQDRIKILSKIGDIKGMLLDVKI
jgi:uncharacterized protein